MLPPLLDLLGTNYLFTEKPEYLTRGTSVGKIDGALDAPWNIINANACPPRTPKLSSFLMPSSIFTTAENRQH